MGLALKKEEFFEQDACKQPSEEYSVYIFHHPDEDHNNRHYWEKIKTTSNKYRALKNAEKLYQSHRYEKVEIKKIAFGKKNHDPVGSTLKVYKSAPMSKAKCLLAILISSITALAILGGFLLFWP